MTLHRVRDNSNLQNTSGHDWEVLLIIEVNGTILTNPIFKIRVSDNLDIADGTVLEDHWVDHVNAVTTEIDDFIIVRVKVPSGKYLTLEEATNNIVVSTGIIIEK